MVIISPIPTIFPSFGTGFAASQSLLSLLEEGEDEGEGGELSADPHPYPLPQVGEGALCRATPIFCRIRVRSYESEAKNSKPETEPVKFLPDRAESPKIFAWNERPIVL